MRPLPLLVDESSLANVSTYAVVDGAASMVLSTEKAVATNRGWDLRRPTQ